MKPRREPSLAPRVCTPVYTALDSATHFLERDPRFAADLASLVSGSPTAKRGSNDTQTKAAAFLKV